MDLSKFTKAARKALPLRPCAAVIVAAGSASRMEGIDKIMAQLGGEPVLKHTVRAFQTCDVIREIVVVTRQELLVPAADLCHEFDKVRGVLAGGKTRQESVRIGLTGLSEKMELVAVQDGARPLTSFALIDRTVRAANTYGAAVPAVAVKDTIKAVKGGLVLATPDRGRLRAVQTPQVFDRELLAAALTQAERENAKITDDCSAVERLGMSVKIVEGDERNLKITTPMDLKIAELLLEEEV